MPVAVGHIVADGVAQNIVQSLGLRHIGTLLADYSDKFAFIVKASAFLSDWMNRNRVRRAGQGCGRLITGGR